MQASVIVPSYNSRSTIDPCLRALQRQTITDAYEVIVVDSSSDSTGAFIAANFPSVRLIRLPQRTLPGPARNMGIQAAEGEILAFTDADCVPAANWLDKMVRAQERGECAAIGGAVLNARPLNPVAWGGYLLEFSERFPSFPRRLVDILPTCNVSFHRRIFEQHGYFPEDLWPSEDHIFSWRLAQAGEPLLFDPQIRVQHIFRPNLGAYLQHQVRLGRASATARKQVPLPHAWLAQHPLRWLVPLIRLSLIEARLIRWDWRNFLRFNLLLPLCLSGLVAWGIGFCSDA
jgi:GT2 family glycosyltransferase